MAVYKPVGVDEDSLFPPRVEERLANDYSTLDRTGTNPFGGAGFTIFGHSYTQSVMNTSACHWVNQLQQRMHLNTPINLGVGGTTLPQIASAVLTQWTPGTRGMAFLVGLINSIRFGETATTIAVATRAILACFTAAAAFQENAENLMYSVGWVNGPTSGSSGTTQRTTTVGSYVDVELPTGEITLMSQMVNDGSGGVITATRAGDGAQVGQWDTNSCNPHAGAAPFPMTVSGLSAGTTVRFSLTSGAGFTVDKLYVPNRTNPAQAVILQEGGVVSWSDQSGHTDAQDNTTLLMVAIPAMDTVIAEYVWANPITVKMADAGWDSATMCGIDRLHPDDKGEGFYATAIGKALVAAVGSTYRDGMNLLTTATPMITPLTPGYYVGSPVVPSAPLSVAAAPGPSQVQLVINPGSTGGSPYTDWSVRYRTSDIGSGAGAWVTFSHTASPSTTPTVTGLTDNVSYDFEVAGVTVVGTGPWSSPTTSIPTGTPFIQDTFNRADAPTLGTASDGHVWTQNSSTLGTASNALSVSSAGTGRVSSIITTGTPSDYAVSFTIALNTLTIGVAGRISDASNFWLIQARWTVGWTLYKSVAGAFTAIGTYGVNPLTNDACKMVFSGTAVAVLINGTQRLSTTDSFNQTATGVGLRDSAATGLAIDSLAATG